jgi:hypothetical protein
MKTKTLVRIACILVLPSLCGVLQAAPAKDSPIILPPPTDPGATKELVAKTKESVLRVVRTIQDELVKESIDQHNCFTNEDYAAFKSDEITKKVVQRLENDDIFRAIARTIAGFDTANRNQINNEARLSFKKTWAQLGKITPQGQTEAGQKAEREIAIAIADLLQKLVSFSQKEKG